MKIIDLSMRIFSGMPVFPGDPEVSVAVDTPLYEREYQLSRIQFGSHTGTHIDAPRHFLPDSAAVSDIDLDCFVGQGLLAMTAEVVSSRRWPNLSETR